MTTRPPSRWLPTALAVLLAPALLLERTRGRNRLALACLYVLVIAAAGVLSWRASSLNRLPDVGDPFDVEAFEAHKVAGDRDAFVIYRQAVGRLKKTIETSDHGAMRRKIVPGGWAAAGPSIHRWIDDNREPLALWRRGTERPEASLDLSDAFRRSIGSPGTSEDLILFHWMALLEASRLGGQGDMAGAWGWYNAALRASRHVGMRGGYTYRSLGQVMHATLGAQVIPWASDPRTDSTTLRRALGDLIAAKKMTRPISDAFKADYLQMIWAYDHPDQWFDPIQCPDDWILQSPTLLQASLFLKREPERSRRITRIIFGHWLAHCDQPPERRPVMSRSIKVGNHTYSDFPYAVALGPPDADHPISAEQLAEWMRSSVYAHRLMTPIQYAIRTPDRERVSHAVLIVNVAEQLFERERGHFPESPDDLVGPYLDRLPEGYISDDPPIENGTL